MKNVRTRLDYFITVYKKFLLIEFANVTKEKKTKNKKECRLKWEKK